MLFSSILLLLLLQLLAALSSFPPLVFPASSNAQLEVLRHEDSEDLVQVIDRLVIQGGFVVTIRVPHVREGSGDDVKDRDVPLHEGDVIILDPAVDGEGVEELLAGCRHQVGGSETVLHIRHVLVPAIPRLDQAVELRIGRSEKIQEDHQIHPVDVGSPVPIPLLRIARLAPLVRQAFSPVDGILSCMKDGKLE